MIDNHELYHENDEILEGERQTTRYVSIEYVMDLQWENNPKLHDIGTTWQSIANHGFRDKAAFDKNLTNRKGQKGAFVFGNGRCEAVWWGWKQSYDVPRGILIDGNGMWYVPVEFGLEADSEASASAFAIDHNVMTAIGGDLGVRELMSMFDQPVLAKVMQSVFSEGADFTTLDGMDFEGLQQYLDVPDFDSGNAQSGIPTEQEGQPQLPPPSTIRMVQLFFTIETIEEFSNLVEQLKPLFDKVDVTDIVLEAMRVAADRS